MNGSYGVHTYTNVYKHIEEGCFVNGMLSNIGKQDVDNGRIERIGEWKDAKLNGEGLKQLNGRQEFGTYKDNKFLGSNERMDKIGKEAWLKEIEEKLKVAKNESN